MLRRGRMRRPVSLIGEVPWPAVMVLVLALVAACVFFLSSQTFVTALHMEGGPAPWGARAILFGIAVALFVVLALAGRWLVAGFQRADRGAERLVLALAIVILAGSWVVSREVDRMLSQFHVPGDAAYGAGVTPLFGFGESPHQRVCTVATTWWTYAGPSLKGTSLKGCGVQTAPAGRTAATTAQSCDASMPAPFPYRPHAPIAVLALAEAITSFGIVPTTILLILLTVRGRRALLRDRTSVHASLRARQDPNANTIITLFSHATILVGWLIAFAALLGWLESGLSLGLIARAWARPIDPPCSGLLPVGCGMFAPPILVWVLYLVTYAKLLLLGFTSLYLLALAYLLLQHRRGPEGRSTRLSGLLRSLAAVRVPLVAIAAFWLLLSNGETPEILWRWRDDVWVGGLGVLLMIGFAAGVRILSTMSLNHAQTLVARRHMEEQKTYPSRGYLWLTVAAGVPVVFSVVLATFTSDLSARLYKAAIPLAIVGTVCLRSLPKRGWHYRQSGKPEFGEAWLPAVLGAAVVALLGLGLLAAATPLLLYMALRPPVDAAYWWLVVVALGLLLVAAISAIQGWGRLRRAIPGVRRLRRPAWLVNPPAERQSLRNDQRLLIWLQASPQELGKRWQHWLWCTGLALTLWLAVALLLVPDWGPTHFAPLVGTTGVVSLALLLGSAVVCGLVGLVTLLAPPPPLFRALRIGQTPVLFLLALWWGLATVLPPHDILHDARVETVVAATQPPPADVCAGSDHSNHACESLAGAFAQWRWQNCLVAASQNDVPTDPAVKPVVPLILLASAGGGIRAAAWTAYVTDRVLGYGAVPAEPCRYLSSAAPATQPRGNRLFVASGISGGSIGLATYVVHSLDPGARQDEETCLPEQGDCATPDVNAQPIPDCEPWPRDQARGGGWVRVRLGHCDGVVPTVAWMLFVEGPWSFLHAGVKRDRARALEVTWEHMWGNGSSDHLLFAERRRE